MLSFTLLSIVLLFLSPAVFAQCSGPVFDGPAVRSVTKATFFISGVFVQDATCNGNYAYDRFLLISEETGEVQSVFTNSENRFSTDVGRQAWGNRNYYLVHPFDSTIRSAVITVTINCAVPIIELPGNDINDPAYDPNAPAFAYTNRPTISGRSDCPFVTIEIPGEPSATITVNEYGGYIARTQPLVNGAYAITVLASVDRQGSNSARSGVRNVVIDSRDDLNTCHPPRITSHTNGSTAISSFTLTGIIDVGTDCDTGAVRILSQDTGEIVQVFTDGSGTFTAQITGQIRGLHYYYVEHLGIADPAYASRAVGITIICAPPIILQPGNNMNDPNYNPYAEVMVYVSRPVISGTSDCPFVTIQIPTQQSVTVPTDGNGAFSVQWRQLQNARYVIAAVASDDGQGTYSARSIDRTIVVQSDDPFPTGNLGRRAALARNRCRPNEEMCRFTPVGKKQRVIQYECISDPTYNLERCGSCSGPDCSALPHVNGVSCDEGKCKVVFEATCW